MSDRQRWIAGYAILLRLWSEGKVAVSVRIMFILSYMKIVLRQRRP